MAYSKIDQFAEDLIMLSAFTKALSHPARLSILLELSKSKNSFCGELVNTLPLAQSTVSQHLKELVKSGLVRAKPMGVNMSYSINKKQMKLLFEQFGTHFSIILKNLKKDKGPRQSKNN